MSISLSCLHQKILRKGETANPSNLVHPYTELEATRLQDEGLHVLSHFHLLLLSPQSRKDDQWLVQKRAVHHWNNVNNII